MSTAGHLHGQTDAADIASLAIDSFTVISSLQDGQLSEDRLHCVTEFQVYFALLIPREQQVASSIQHILTDSLLDFAAAIRMKPCESPVPESLAAVTLHDVPVTSKQLSVLRPQTSDSQCSLIMCTYCTK